MVAAINRGNAHPHKERQENPDKNNGDSATLRAKRRSERKTCQETHTAHASPALNEIDEAIAARRRVEANENEHIAKNGTSWENNLANQVGDDRTSDDPPKTRQGRGTPLDRE